MIHIAYPRAGDALYPMGVQDRLHSSVNLQAFKEQILIDCTTTTGWAISDGVTTLQTTNIKKRGTGGILMDGLDANTTSTFTPSSNIDLSHISGVSSGIARAGIITCYVNFPSAVIMRSFALTLADGSAVTYTIYFNWTNSSGTISEKIAINNNASVKLVFDLQHVQEVSTGSFNWTDIDTIAITAVTTAADNYYILESVTATPTISYGGNVIDACEATSGWTATTGTMATSTATDKVTQTYLVASAVPNAATLLASKTITSIDLSNQMGASTGRPTVRGPVFSVYVKPSHVNTGSTSSYMEFRIGSDASNYYSVRYYHGVNGDFDTEEWVRLYLDPYTSGMTGTPDNAALDYAAVYLNHSASVALTLSFDEILYGNPTLFTVYNHPGYIYYKNDRYLVSAGYQNEQDLNGRYIIATINDSTNVATISNIAYGTALTQDQIIVGYVQNGRLYNQHGGEIKEEIVYQEWGSSVENSSLSLDALYLPFHLFRDYIELTIQVQDDAATSELIRMNYTAALTAGSCIIGEACIVGDATTNGTATAFITMDKNYFNTGGLNTLGTLTGQCLSFRMRGY